MTSTAHVLRNMVVASILVFGLASGTAFAQDGGKLGEMDLPPAPIVIDLSDASVQITVTDTAEPGLRWWPAVIDSPGSADVSAFSEGAAVVIARPALAEGESAARIRLEVVMGRDQNLSITGEALELEVERARQTEVEQVDLDGAAPTAVVTVTEVQMTNSEIAMSGVGSVVGVLENCTASLRRTIGDHQLSLRDSELRVAGHQGSITIETEESDVIAEDARGSFATTGYGGSVDLRSTRGRIKVELVSADLSIDRGRLTGLIALTDSSADIRDARFQKSSIKSVTSHLTASSCQGDLTIDLTGGSLSADSGNGSVTGTARDGARIDLADHQGNVKLNLQTDSSTDLRMIRGDVNLTSRAAEVAVDGAASLTASFADTWASLNGIEKVKSFQVVRSEVDIDLSSCRERSVEIAIREDSSVRVDLASPCLVQAKGVSAGLASQIDVTGCELQLGRSNRSATRRVRGVDGNPPILLTAQVAESAELIVSGRP